MYSYLSTWYDLLAGRWEIKATKKAISILDPKPGEIILDIGCGTGTAMMSLLHSSGGSGEIYGVDVSRDMLAVAQNKIMKYGLEENICMVQSNATALPYLREMFDAILMTFFIELLSEEDMRKVLNECKRVLKPEGRICILSLSKSKPNISSKIYEAAHYLLPSIFDCRPIYLRKIVEANGFKISTTIDSTLFSIPIETVCALN